MNPYFPKISIITPSYNQGKYIKDNIDSVLQQNYPNYEHIIVDGGSNDNTLQILQSYTHLNWISEPDKGPVDAINKGIAMSSGEIITWLNSDDFYPHEVLEKVANIFISKKVDIVVGNMKFYGSDKEYIYTSNHIKNYNLNYLIKVNSDIITQPSTFFTKDIFIKSGGFDESLKLVWDYDLFIKMFKHSIPYFLNDVLACQRIYDNTLSRNNARKQAIEIFRVSRKNGANLTDPIMKLVLKRILFPDVVKSDPGLIIRNYRKIKKVLNKMKN